MNPPLKKLPIGIQTFSEVITEGYTYVDKTPYALALANTGKYYFLSRPRRFGKSLFLDTLKELFEGSEALFRGLDLHPHWDWSRRHPVIRLDFAGGVVQSPERLDEAIETWVRDMPPEFLVKTMRYANSKGTQREHPAWQAMTHFFNHQTHHRGQATTLLAQAGIDPGVTDLIALA